MNYLAHISDDGREQSIKDHLHGTAKLCGEFAETFGAEEQGRLLGTLHDIGKYSDAFQKRLHGGPKVDHATAGAIESARMGAEWGAFCIAGHHSGIPNGGNWKSDAAGDPTLIGRLKKGIAGQIPPYQQNWSKTPLSAAPLTGWGNEPLADSFLIRMLYSCLVDADYLDTEAFMRGETAKNTYDTIPVLLEKLNRYISGWKTPTTDLNRLRCGILQSCIEEAAGEKSIYTLTVPTGGGKTVASMAFALHHAQTHGMKRVVYVIPYTSIIEQNAAVFRSIFGDENVLEHHSGVLTDLEDETDGLSCRQALSAENWDAPIIVTTAVQFFESLYSNRASRCRKLHNLADSVIVFDEAQMLPAAHLRPCVAAIAGLVKLFGSTAVLCTATQPVLGDLFREYAEAVPIREICKNTEELYQKFQRVSFRKVGQRKTEDLAGELAAHLQVLCIVNTRAEARRIYELLPKEGSFHLSTLMYPAHRQRVLSEIRSRLTTGLPCRVVSTSLIEAGVDVDFPTVYRELAGLDSVLQAAGRCNREGKRQPDESIVTVFEGETAPPVLFRVNIGAAKEALSKSTDLSDPRAVQRYFSSFRSLAGEKLDACGVVNAFRKGIDGCAMPFETVSEQFRLIENVTRTVYIPDGDGLPIIEKLRSGERSRSLYRMAGRYGVNVYEQHYLALLEAGDVLPLDADSAILVNCSLYDPATGLSLKADTGKGLFI